MNRYWTLIALIGMILVSCSKSVDDHGIGVQPVLFEYEFINHAWIETHFGWMIDAEGQLHGYSRTDDWTHPEDNQITRDHLVNNLSLCDTLYGAVDNQQLLKYFDLRNDFAMSRIDTADRQMADAGVGTLYVYMWDSKKQLYKRVVLASQGDLQLTNKHPNASGAIRFLVAEGEKTGRFFWGF